MPLLKRQLQDLSKLPPLLISLCLWGLVSNATSAVVYKSATPSLNPEDPTAWYGSAGYGDEVMLQDWDTIEFGEFIENSTQFDLFTEMNVGGLRFTSALYQPVSLQLYAEMSLGSNGIWVEDSSQFVTLNGPLKVTESQTWETNLHHSGLFFGGTISGDASTTLTLNGRFTSDHASGLNSALAELTNNSGNRAFTFTGWESNTFSGNIVVNNAILALHKVQGAIAIQGNVQANGASAVYLMADQQLSSSSILTLTGGAKYIINGFNQTLGGLAGSGTTSLVEAVSNGGGASTLSLNVAAGQTYHFNGGILRNGASGILDVVKTGAGTQMLTGSMAFTGGLRVNEGMFVIRGTGLNNYNSNLFTITDWKSAITVEAGARLTLEHVQTATTTEELKIAVTGAGNLEKAGVGTIRLNADNSNHTGLVWIREGILEVTGGKAIRDLNTVEFNNHATAALRLVAHETIGGLKGGGATGGNVQLQTQNLTLQRNEGTLTYQGVISGTGNLIKTGAGEQILSGNNTFTGTAIIQQGSLSVSGGNAIANTATVRVEAHASSVFKLLANEAIKGLEGGSTTAGTVDTGIHALTVQDGTFAGVITGTDRSGVDTANFHKFTSLVKTGNGTLYLTGTNNTYRGFTEINQGILNIAKLGDVGQASSLGQRMAENSVSDVGLIFRGGTLQYTGSTAQSTNRAVRIDINGGAYIDASGSNPQATMSFTRSSSPDFFVSAGSRQLTLTGSNQGNNTWNMSIAQTGGTTTLNKTGTGHWVLTGSHNYTGETNLQGGALLINGTVGNTAVNVASGAKLGGTGTIGGNTTVLGQVTPGGDSSQANFSNGFGFGTLKFGNTARLSFSGPQASLFAQLGASGQSDRLQLDVTSGISLTLGTGTTLNGTFSGDSLSDVLNHSGDTAYSKYWIGVLADGASSSGKFANSEEQNLTFWGAILGSGLSNDWNQAHHLRWGSQDFALFYNADFTSQSFTGGNDLLMIAVVPEPKKSLLLFGACLAIGLLRKRS